MDQMDQEKQPQIVITVWEGNKQQQFYASRGENLLMALVRAKLPVSFSCTTGKCRSCMLRLQAPVGSVSFASATEQYRLGKDALEKGYRLACQVYLSGSLAVYLDAPASA